MWQAGRHAGRQSVSHPKGYSLDSLQSTQKVLSFEYIPVPGVFPAPGNGRHRVGKESRGGGLPIAAFKLSRGRLQHDLRGIRLGVKMGFVPPGKSLKDFPRARVKFRQGAFKRSIFKEIFYSHGTSYYRYDSPVVFPGATPNHYKDPGIL